MDASPPAASPVAVSALANSPFKNLPPEMFEEIASHVDVPSLKALCFVCREMAANTVRSFAKKAFEEQAYFLHDEQSLELAVTVAKHRFFGAATQKFAFFVEEVAAPEFGDRLKNMFDTDTQGDSVHLKAYRRFQELKALNFKPNLDLLVSLFCALANVESRHKIKSILLTDMAFPVFKLRPVGSANRIRDRNPYKITVQSPSMHSSWPAAFLFNALHTSRCSPRRLAITASDWILPARYSSAWSQKKCQAVLSHTRLLTIATWAVEGDSKSVSAFQKVITKAPNLKHLCLYSPTSAYMHKDYQFRKLRNFHLTEDLLLTATLPKLRSVRLFGAEMKCRVLLDFVERHRGLNLHLLDLSDCWLYGLSEIGLRKRSLERGLRRLIGLSGSYIELETGDDEIESDDEVDENASAYDDGSDMGSGGAGSGPGIEVEQHDSNDEGNND